MLTLTVGTPVLEAQILKRAAIAAALRVKKTADVFDVHGKLVAHIENQDFGPSAVPKLAVMRADTVAIEKWRDLAVRYGKKSKRGPDAAAGLVQIAEAMTAGTKYEFHEAVKKLPVRIVRTAVTDALGRNGIQTEVISPRGVRVRLFEITGDNESEVSATPVQHSEADMPQVDDDDSSPSLATVSTSKTALDDCYSYGAPDACATQQEIDDAIAVTVSLDEELGYVDSDVQGEDAELGDYCGSHSAECGTSDEAFLESSTDIASIGGPRAMDYESLAMPCRSEFNNFVGALFVTHGTGIVLVAMCLAATPPGMLAVAGTLLILLGSGFWAVSGAESFLDCARRIRLQQ